MRYHVIFNARSGTALSHSITAHALAEQFRGAGLAAVIDDDRHLLMVERLSRAVTSDAEVVVAAGGDGTVTAVAAALVGTSKSMAILPLGTVNLLARDLGVPLELGHWMATLTDMEPCRMDVGEVNGRVFLHKVVVGVIPGIAAGREHIRGSGGLAARIAFVKFFFRRLLRSRRMVVDIVKSPRSGRSVRVAAVAVANNAYDEGPGRFFSRQRLDRGHLTIYLVRHLTVGDLFRLTAEMVLGRWQRDEAIEIEPTRELILRTGRRRVQVMRDGEVESLATPLDFHIRPRALSVMAPPACRAVETVPTPAAAAQPSPAGAG